ncbi:MAG TPA: hypothetical protein VNK70_00895 [Candidatus Paceibacterota bacterium]|nr:hypothetical protein [Candidatus Paceibacterota bacterium]
MNVPNAEPHSKKLTVTIVVAVVVVVVAAAVYWWISRGRELPSENALESPGAVSLPEIDPVSNPLEKLPEVNPVDATNPFLDIRTNPFE